MNERRDSDSPDTERRGSSRRLSWMFRRAKKASAPQDRDSEEGLTRVLDRSGLTAVAAEMLALASRTREAVACTFIEVRGPRTVNDVDGHDAGAEAVETAADALGAVFRRSDVLARWGSNSFVVLSLGPGPGSDDVERRMTQRLQPSTEGDSSEKSVGISAGRVVHMPWQEEDLDQIVERADQEMSRRCQLERTRDQDFEEQ